MKTLPLIFLMMILAPNFTYAEDVVRHTGAVYEGCSNLAPYIFLSDKDDISTVKDGYIYINDSRGCASLPGSPQYRKIENVEVVSMTAQEIADKNAADQAAAQAQADAAFNAQIDALKAQVDSPSDPSILLNKCITDMTMDELRQIKAGSPRASRTDQQLRDAVKACLDGFKR